MESSGRPLLNEEDLPNAESDSSFEIPPLYYQDLEDRGRLTEIKESLKKIWTSKIIPNVGLFLIILSQFFNSVMVVATKLLESDPEFTEPIHPLQILFVRMLITVTGCFLFLKYVKKEPEIFGPKPLRWLLVMRGVVGFSGVFSMYYSLLYLSVSDAVVITFLVPSVTGFLAWVILREKWTLMEAGGGLVSLVGVLLIARPSFIFGHSSTSTNDDVETSDPEERVFATLVGLAGVVGASFVYICIRKIGKRVHSLVTVEYFSAICVVISLAGIILIPGLSFRIPHTKHQWFLFFTLGISGFFMQFLLTEGIQREKASRASAMLYTQMVYAIFWEVLVWNHLPSIWSWMGILIILSSAFVVIYFKPSESIETKIENDPENVTESISLTAIDEVL